MQNEISDKPFTEEEWPDYYGEVGCCTVCDVNGYKEIVKGLEVHIYFEGKYYDCVCLDCKCRKCDWYDPYDRECVRKFLVNLF